MNSHFTYPSDGEQSSLTRPESNISMASSSNAASSSQNIPISPLAFYNNSLAIRHEIQRFESVHPSIYAVYDLLDMIGGNDGQLIAQRIRDHVVCIEDSFVNSQEWTLSRAVPDLRLGVVGTIHSGKSALVHRYLTGTYLQDESPEGGRFKKEVTIDGQSYLLLIRDEGGPPEMQFSCWADAVLFVYNTENESSFNEIFTYYNKMFHLRSNHDIPIFLIGITDAISNPSSHSVVVDQSRAKKLAAELKNCQALEANPVLGQNVDNVFHQACQHMITSRNNIENSSYSRPTTPKSPYSRGPLTLLNNIIPNNRFTHSLKSHSPLTVSSPLEPPLPPSSPIVQIGNVHLISKIDELESRKITLRSSAELSTPPPPPQHKSSPQTINTAFTTPTGPTTKPSIADKPKNLKLSSIGSSSSVGVPPASLETLTSQSQMNTSAPAVPKRTESMRYNPDGQFKMPLPPTPSGLQETPEREDIVQRKNRRKSNLFTPLTAYKKSSTNNEEKLKNGEVGVGRAIPIKQGYLYKKSKKALNKDWRKKYVTLTTNGCLTYHPTLHDYMNDVHGKNISLKHTTVKIPGGKPRVGRQSISVSPNIAESSEKMVPSTNPKYENNKKRSRKLKNIGIKNDSAEDSDGNEFVIVSLDNKQWLFNAMNNDDRENWMKAIEQQILSSLQNTECDKSKVHNVNGVDDQTIHSIRTVPGNSCCVDCSAKDPDWASLNLGTLICIDCSGIHRKIGTHISKVRSLTLDVWPSSHVAVMLGLGNTAANRIWEANLNGYPKPSPNSGHEEKEKFIRSKYETKDFLAALPNTTKSIELQIFDAVIKMDIKLLAILLAHLAVLGRSISRIESTNDRKTPLHFAAKLGCLEITQLLLWNNVNEKAIDTEGKTALFYAKVNGHREIDELLVQSGCTMTTVDVKNPPNDSAEKAARRDSLQLHMKSMDQFNKLHTSII